MKISQLQYFLDAAESHSLHKSAERCNISVQGLSKAIKSLEEELGVELVTRTSKGIFLTKAGEHLQKSFSDIVKIYANISEYCDALNTDTDIKTVKGEVKVAVTTRFVESYFGKIMSQFNMKYPDIKICVESFDNFKTVEQIQKEDQGINLGIVSIIETDALMFDMEKYILENDLHLDKFYQSEMYMCGAIKTINKFTDMICKSEDSKDIPIVTYRYGVDATDEFQYHLNSITAQKEMITNQGAMGAYTLHEFNLHFNKKRYAYIPHENKIVLNYSFIRRKKHKLTQAEQLFVTFLFEKFK